MSNQLSIGQRLFMGAIALVLLTLLGAAARLSPDDRGYGTHEQLGMGACFVVLQWGFRCPSCGMTTSWSNLLDGNIGSSIAANAGGALLCLLAIAAVPWLLASATKGQWWYLRPQVNLLIPVLVVVLLVTIMQWMQHTGLVLLRQGLS